MADSLPLTVLISTTVVVGIGAQVLAKWLQIPSIVLLLLFGILLGSSGLGVLEPSLLGHGLEVIVSLAIALILFEGGLNLRVRNLSSVSVSLRNLVTIGVLLTFLGGAIAAHGLNGFPWTNAFLYASLVVVTGPTVVTPLLRLVGVEQQMATILEGEGILIDPIGAIMAVITLTFVLSQHEVPLVLVGTAKKFSGKVIEIHERYFHSFDKSFNKYESKARQIVEVQALAKWSEYLGDYPTEEPNGIEQIQGYRGHTKWKRYKGKNGFVLLIAKTTTIIRGVKDHAVDCYVELWHNGHQVAEAYGEAKNCPLIKEHIDTFHKWLAEFSYEPFPTDGNPPDLAFIISPSATDLQKRKLKIKSIEFIAEERIDDNSSNTKTEISNEGRGLDLRTIASGNGISINESSEAILKAALKTARFQAKTIDRLIMSRPYKSFKDLVSKTGISSSIRKKLQDKIDSGDISFD